jgi:predicted transcriptional regulator
LAQLSQQEAPLTPGQVALLRAVRKGGAPRAATIATRSSVKVECVYPMLSRLVDRELLKKGGSRPPTYELTAKGMSLLLASETYHEALAEESE